MKLCWGLLLIGALVGLAVGFAGGTLHAEGITKTSIGILAGILMALLLTPLIAIATALAGDYKFGPLFWAVSVIALFAGVFAGAVTIHSASLIKAMVIGLLMGAVIGYLLCLMCDRGKVRALVRES